MSTTTSTSPTSKSDVSKDDVEFPKSVFGIRTIFRITMHLVSRYTVIGRENRPDYQFLMTTNHLSFFDVPAMAGGLNRDVAVFAAKKYLGTRREWMFRLGSPVWIEQEAPDRQALMFMLKLAKQGYNIGAAPEGHRSKTGGLLQGQEGAAFLATRANLPILPIVTWGTEKIFKHPRPKVTVKIGKPYQLPEGRAKGDQLKEYTDRVMCALAALLPEQYHGVYAGHPLIEEMAKLVR
jgi:1-acyl-sn-glycerol-3-phosphate acyltransferase